MGRGASLYLDHMATMAAKQTGRAWVPITEADSFPKQWEAISDWSREQVWWGSRRMAKTGTSIRRTVKRSSEMAQRRTLYIHHTRTLAKQQFYETGDPRNPGVRELLAKHGIPEAHHDLTELNVTLGNGSFVQVLGCDDARDVGRKLGFLWDDILIDECQDFPDEILRRLLKIIRPTLIDRKGTLTLSGTAPDAAVGIWYEMITDESMVRHHWTMLDNPFIPRENIVEVMGERGLAVDFENPLNNSVIVQRDVFGLLVFDPEAVLYCYNPVINDWPVTGPPFLDDAHKPEWRYAMGVDIGGVEEHHDHDAIVVYGWRMTDGTKSIWERESWRGHGDDQDFFQRVVDTFKRWQPMQSVCADTGGAGAVKMLARISPQMGGLQFTPKPTSVETSQRFLNDELRSGRMKVNQLGELAKAFKLCRKGKHEIDVAAAARYAFHGAYNWLAKEKKPPLPIDQELDRRRIERWKQQEKESRRPWQVM